MIHNANPGCRVEVCSGHLAGLHGIVIERRAGRLAVKLDTLEVPRWFMPASLRREA